MISMKDKVVFITGGNRGIGRATAIRFASLGAKVVICGRNQVDLINTHQTIVANGGNALALVGDITQISDCQRMIQETIAHYHRLDVLVNNAGMSMRGRFQQTDLTVFHQIMAINFSGAVNMTHFALPHLQGQ